MTPIASSTGTAAPGRIKRQIAHQEPLSAFSVWVVYAYLLRFPILGWLALPALCWLDGCTGASALTRGIMTMSRGWQAFHTTFFAVALEMTVLICAKNMVVNGAERFSVRPPRALWRVLRTRKPRTMWFVLGFVQLPALVTLIYVGWRTVSEQTGWAQDLARRDVLLQTVWPEGGMHWRLYGAVAAGVVAAAVFWYLVSVFYYWTYPAPSEHAKKKSAVSPTPTSPATGEANSAQSDAQAAAAKEEKRQAVPLLFPVRLDYRPEDSQRHEGEASSNTKAQPGKPKGLTVIARYAQKPRFAVWLEWLPEKLLRFPHPGYGVKEGNRLYELHFLSIVSLGAIVLLYLFLYPLVAPVVVSRLAGPDTLLALGIAAAFVAGSSTCETRRIQPVGWLFTGMVLAALCVFLTLCYQNSKHHLIVMETAFPTLGAILVILIMLEWMLSGVTFFLDRFRAPVLSAVLVFMLLLRSALGIHQEHYFEVKRTGALAATEVSTLR